MDAQPNNGAPAPGGQVKPFPFFVGAGRSGTTLVRAIFDSHSDMTIPGESRFVVRMAHPKKRGRYETEAGFDSDAFVSDLTQRYRFGRWGLPEDEIRTALGDAPVNGYPDAVRRLFQAQAARQGKGRYGDKTPAYVLHLPLLARLFPEARFVHIIRDGRDVALSHLDINEWGPASLEEAALDWKHRVAKGRRDGAGLGPTRYREMRYEDLLDDPEAEVRKLCSFLELSYEEGMLRYFERADRLAGSIPHFQNLHKPLTKGLRDWRSQMADHDVTIFEVLAGDLLEDLGYGRGAGPIPVGRRAAAHLRRLGVHARWVQSNVHRVATRVHGRGRGTRSKLDVTG